MNLLLGENIAKQDTIIFNSLKNIVDKENKLIEQYNFLKKLNNSCPQNLKNDLEKLLEARKLFIEYKIMSNDDQLKSLYKLLEYLNTLEDKKKEFDVKIILEKINSLEKNLKYFSSLDLN